MNALSNIDMGEVTRLTRAGKLATFRNWFLHQPVRVLPRPVEAACRQRIHGAVDRRDALFQRVEQVVRRDLAAFQARHDHYGILADEIVVHLDFPEIGRT